MLKRFAVTNYKNFRDRIELDLGAVHNYGFNDHCVRSGILNKALLLGKNGSGKSNLGLAIFDIVGTLTDNLIHPKQSNPSTYLNANSDRKNAEFFYEFTDDGRTFEYTYRKTDFYNIVYEEFTVDGTRIFLRDGVKSDYSGLVSIGADQLRMNIRNGRLSVLRFIYANTQQGPDSPVYKVMDFVSRMLYFKSDTEGNGFIGYGRPGELISDYIIRKGLTSDFQKMLSEVAGLEMKLEVVKSPGTNGVIASAYKRKKVPFDAVASTGTKVFSLFYYWYKQMEGTTFVYMDEFDAYYHHEMAAKIIRLVSEMRGFQTIFTSHNTSLLSNDLMRPDCYLYLDDKGIRSFSDSTDRELRMGHNIEKMYRNGAFDE